jgi:hypothetical protein
MVKFFHIAFILILIQNNVSGQQVAHATITATITTPVGAEISNDISFEKFAKMTSTKKGVITAENNEMKNSVKVIGESFAYNVTIQNDNQPLKRKKDVKEPTLSTGNEPPLSITVNFD